jgi:hypothetical protein
VSDTCPGGDRRRGKTHCLTHPSNERKEVLGQQGFTGALGDTTYEKAPRSKGLKNLARLLHKGGQVEVGG